MASLLGLLTTGFAWTTKNQGSQFEKALLTLWRNLMGGSNGDAGSLDPRDGQLALLGRSCVLVRDMTWR